MNNPFQNLNTKYTPSTASLSFVLSKINSKDLDLVPTDNISWLSNLKKSPLYTWSLAGGLSFAGMAAALLFFIQSPTSIPVDHNVAIVDIKNTQMRNVSIDEALNSVASFDDTSTLNKKF